MIEFRLPRRHGRCNSGSKYMEEIDGYYLYILITFASKSAERFTQNFCANGSTLKTGATNSPIVFNCQQRRHYPVWQGQ